MDSSFRPALSGELHRKKAKPVKVRAVASKLDEVAEWKAWGQVLGIRLLGLRALDKLAVFILWCHSVNVFL